MKAAPHLVSFAAYEVAPPPRRTDKARITDADR